MHKKKLLILVFILLTSLVSFDVCAGTYEEQIEMSGADTLRDSLPSDARKSLENIGIDGFKWEDMSNIRIEKILGEIFGKASEYTAKPLRALAVCVGIILLCAIVDSLKDSFSRKPLGGVMNVVGSLCMCICVVNPVISCIAHAGKVISYSCTFMMSYIPILAGIMIATGQTISSLSYQLTMMATSELLFKISTDVIVPTLYIFLALSVVSSISPKLHLSHIPNIVYKWVKYLLVFFVSVFTTIITIQNMVGASADNVGNKAAKAIVGGLVPVVGYAISDALSTIYGYVSLLKSSVGAFGIIAILFIFVPILTECAVWSLSANLCSVLGDIFELGRISHMLRGIARTVNIMIAIIISLIVVMIVSTTVVLMVGGIIK